MCTRGDTEMTSYTILNITQAVSVKSVDFYFKENGDNHHTGKFNLMTRESDKCLVVRRGQPFKLKIHLNRPYQKETDAVSFIFNVADVARSGPNKLSHAAVPLLEKGTETTKVWNAKYEGQIDDNLVVAITPSSDCIVASWNLEIDTKLVEGGSARSTQISTPIYILFNPWCPNDTVYLPESAQRAEYVLEEGGLLYRGVYSHVKSAPWHYAQHERDVLDCALYLVRELAEVRDSERGDPIQTCRALSAAVNVQDDNGVLCGNWNDDYSGGTNPMKWVGSQEILQRFYQTKKPVKYAQCWVYAGVLTTLCRALGIPCRPVTAYNAAHDYQGSFTIDVILDDQGNTIKKYSEDIVWNYHVWNEVWMEREDLGEGYGGWQALDSTPQEQSGNMYRCGPASLRAVKEADIKRPYDAAFVYAQINADKVIWKECGDTLKMIGRDTTSIGQNISTKAIGSMDREDVTHLYKYPEHTNEERATLMKALRTSESRFARYYLNEQSNGIQFKFLLLDDVKIGQDFNVILNIQNGSSSDRHQLSGVLRVNSVTYTGRSSGSVKQHDFNLTMEPKQKHQVKMAVTFDDYYKILMDQAAFNVTCLATIVDTDLEYFVQDDFRLRNPDIKFKLHSRPVSREEVTVTIKVENPMPIPLTNCKFYVQAPGLCNQRKIVLDENVAPGAFATAVLKLTPPWSGRHQISAKFNSKEMTDVDGFLSFTT